MKKYIKSFVYGGLDGLITTFAIVMSSVSANLSFSIVIGLGVANLLADGFSMAFGDYISTKSENEANEITNKDPIKNAFVTFFSFAIFGFLPILIFIISYLLKLDNIVQVSFITILTILSLAILGFFKAKINNSSKFKSSIEMSLLGGLVAIIAYFVGNIF